MFWLKKTGYKDIRITPTSLHFVFGLKQKNNVFLGCLRVTTYQYCPQKKMAPFVWRKIKGLVWAGSYAEHVQKKRSWTGSRKTRFSGARPLNRTIMKPKFRNPLYLLTKYFKKYKIRYIIARIAILGFSGRRYNSEGELTENLV